MRIACIHVPQFALQCATRLDPSLRGAPIAVVSGVEPGRERAGVLHAPVVLACSRAAWSHGVRLGMTATAARSQAPDIAIVTADPAAERETVRAMADAMLALSPTVDVGGRVGAGGAHLAMYAEVPVKTRGTSFGDRLVELLGELGVAARIGIADDRFTAWVAAAYGVHAPGAPAAGGRGQAGGGRVHAAGVAQAGSGRVHAAGVEQAGGGRVHAAGVEQGPVGGGSVGPRRRRADSRAQSAQSQTPTSQSMPLALPLHGHAEAHEHHEGAVVNVPRGGSAAFLAPRPLSLLAIPSEVQHMLEALGIRTLGEFASLPAPSVARPLEADYQGLARGESGATLRPYHPEAPVREEIVVSSGTVLELAGSLSGAAAIAAVSRRIAMRLAGRGRGAARLDVTMMSTGSAMSSSPTSMSPSAVSGSAVSPRSAMSSSSAVPTSASSNDNAPMRREVPVTIDGAVVEAEEIARVLAPVLDSATDELPQLAQRGGWKLRVVVAGEALVSGETVEILAEGTAPFARAESPFARAESPFESTTSSHPARAAHAHGAQAQEAHAHGAHAHGAHAQEAHAHGANVRGASNAGLATPSLFDGIDSERVLDPKDSQIRASGPMDISPLAVVLSSSGSLFALSAPTTMSERRDVHQRTRRGKQRRSRPTPQVQPRLFDRTSYK